MRFQLVFSLGLSLVCAFPGFSLASETLADQHACLNCHQVAKKSIGPSFKSIAAKYKGNADANQQLATKIVKGGSGVWGAVPMPPMAEVPPEELKQIVTWLLAQ